MKIPDDVVKALKKAGLYSDFEKFLNMKMVEQELCSHGGALSRAVHPWYGAYNPDKISIDIYDKMKTNPQVAAGLKCIKYPVLALNWHVKSDSQEVREFVVENLKPLWRGLIESSLTAVEYGFSTHEIVYEKRDGKAFLKKIKSLHPKWININLDEHDNFLGFTQTWMGRFIQVPRVKAFIFTHGKGESFGNLFGESRLKPAYEPWYWWSTLIQFMMKYFERRGIPPTKVRFPPGKTKEGKSTAEVAVEMGRALQSESVVAIPSSVWEVGGKVLYKWDVEYLDEQRRGDMFQSALVSLEAKILRAMFVPERVITQDTLSKAGSYSLSKVHADMFLLGEEGLTVSLEDQINKYLISKLVEINFGKKAWARVEMERITEARKQFLKDVFMEMLKSGDAKPAADAIADYLGLPMEGKQPEAQEAEEKSETSISLEESQSAGRWWRELAEFEDEKMLADIEDKVDIEKEALANELISILDDVEEKVVSKLDSLLRRNEDLGDLWYRNVRTITPEGMRKIEKVVWEPRRSDVRKAFLNKMKEMYFYGQKTAFDELGMAEDPKVDKRYWDKLQMRVQTILDEFYSNLRYKVNLAITETAASQEAPIPKVRAVFSVYRNKKIPTMCDTELMMAFNIGRKQVADYYGTG